MRMLYSNGIPYDSDFPSYALAWYFSQIVSLIASLIILKYFYWKGYRICLLAGGLETAANFFKGILLHDSIIEKTLNIYLLPVTGISLIAGMLFCISLIFTARKNSWLFVSGIVLISITIISGYVFVWGSETRSIQEHILIKRITPWVALIGNLVPLLFMLQFWSELSRQNGVEVLSNNRRLVMSAIFLATMGIIFYYAGNKMSRNLVVEQKRVASPRSSTLAQNFEANVYVETNGDSLPYRLLKPLHYDKSKNYPLVVSLHHGGGHGTDNISQMEASGPAEMLSMYLNKRKFPCFVLVPQCPPDFNWGGVPFNPAADSLVFKTIYKLQHDYSIDKSRIYVAGVSMGGIGSWHFITIRPDMFAAAIPVCGAGDTALAKKIVSIPIWAFHGAKDQELPVAKSREIILAIKNAGGHPRYTEYPEASHNIWELVSETEGLLDWLFAQRKK